MRIPSTVAAASLALLAAACGSSPPPAPLPGPTTALPPAPPTETSTPIAAPAPKSDASPSLAAKVAQFAPVKLTADASKLPASEKQAMDKLITAAKLLDPIFNHQAMAGYDALRDKLAADASPAGKEKLEYFDIMRGPWDRQDHFAPFAIDHARPKGAGFYPEDLTADEMHSWLAAHPDDKKAFESLTTVIKRDGQKLVAVPFHEEYKQWLEPAAKLLRDASELTTNKTLKRFLASRAQAFVSDDYYQSDKDWMDLDSAVEVTIGPYETYEDDLLGLKASYEAFVTLSDPAESAKLAKYKKLLPAMEQNLPIPDAIKTKRGSESPIRVVDLVFTSGDARKSVQTIAFNLPNDERVRAEKGAKKVLLRNLIETKFDVIMKPIGERIVDPSQVGDLSATAFFDETLFHELSHSLGPAFTTKKVEVRKALEASFSAIEEAKADVMGAYNVLYMIERGEMKDQGPDFAKKLLTSYFAGLFRSVRFGVSEAHGQGSAMQINRILEAGGARFDESTKKFTVDYDKLRTAMKVLVKDICIIQHDGDKAAADALLAKYGTMSDPMKKALASLDGIPVDVKPTYPLAGE